MSNLSFNSPNCLSARTELHGFYLYTFAFYAAYIYLLQKFLFVEYFSIDWVVCLSVICVCFCQIKITNPNIMHAKDSINATGLGRQETARKG